MEGTIGKSGYPVVEEEQRIVVSILAYEVYDKMTERVKNYKTDGMGDPGLEEATDDEAVSTLVESNVSQYRYGGFALHSLMKKYEKSNSKDEVNFLQLLQVKHNEVSTLPFGIQQLQQGGLKIISPCMLPYLRTVIEKVSSLINKFNANN